MPGEKSKDRKQIFLNYLKGIALGEENVDDLVAALEQNIKIDEVVEALETVLALYLDFQNTANTRLDEIQRLTRETLEEIDKKSTSVTQATEREIKDIVETRLNRAIDTFSTSLNKALKEQQQGMNLVYDKLATLKPGEKGEPGKDADPKAVADLVVGMLPDVESLEGGIERLEKEIEELKKRPVGRGGGTSAIGVAQAFKYIGKTESVQGTIDGVNTEFTVNHDIFYVFGFTLNGEQIAEIPNFSYKGRTITFNSAIPAAYSGKDFEIKYV